MILKRFLYLLPMSCFVVYSPAHAADSFRCANGLVLVGDSKAAAEMKCGQPVAKNNFCKPTSPLENNAARVDASGAQSRSTNVTVVANSVCETVDEYTDSPGYGQFITTLRFESGKLASISYGDRVK